MRFQFKPTDPWPNVSLEDWLSWTWQQRTGLSTLEQFRTYFELTPSEAEALKAAPSLFQVRTTPYYAALAHRSNSADPIRQMIIPQQDELSLEGQQVPDPLGEKKHSPGERLVHRYPDRVLFLVTDQCSVYCRYCLRKHFTGQDQAFIGSADYTKALSYLQTATGVREVILSGGDPLTLSDSRLERILSDLRRIEHLEIIRIGSRMPVVSPMRITQDLVQLLQKFKPVYLMTHFNHPKELSHEAAVGLERLVDHGVPVYNQLVLLNGINNHPAIVQALSRRLLYLRVKPYYMFQCDPSQGSEHFRTSIENSLEIQRELWGRLSGLAMPNLSLDIPGGGGKVGWVPNFFADNNNRPDFSSQSIDFIGWDGVKGEYRAPLSPSREPSDVNDYLSEWESLKSQPYGLQKR